MYQCSVYKSYLVYTLKGFKCINVLYIYTLYTHWKGLNVSMFCIGVGSLIHCIACHAVTTQTSSMDIIVSKNRSNPSLWWGVVNLKYHGYYCIQELIKPFFMMRSSKPKKLYFWFMLETLVLNWENLYKTNWLYVSL